MNKFLKVKDVAEQLRVSTASVRHYANQGEIKYDLTPKGQRVFTQEYVNEFLGLEKEEKIVFYIRSSNGNIQLMDTQKELLKSQYGEPLKVYQDKASGLNENRKGLENLFKDAKEGLFTTVCITEKDRLTRFGYKYLEDHLNTLNIKIITLITTTKEQSLHEELLQDFMSLVASFSGKFYRLRGYEQQRRLLKDAENKLNE